jgi:triacylglycerol lipase
MNLVLASGFLIPQRLKRLDYFRDVAKKYPEALFPRVALADSIGVRANQLAEQIAAAFPSGRIDIIAHSMGGLDARYLLSRNLCGLATRVATLSTISTPHRGSPVADLLAGPTPLGTQRLVYEIVKDALARQGYAIGGLASLTTGAAMTFNQQCPDAPGVTYLAYAGCGPRCYALRAGGWVIERAASTTDERLNDGLVSVASAQWPGTQLAEPPWPADHLAEIGYDLDHPGAKPKFDYLGAITRVVERALAVIPTDEAAQQLAQAAP